MFASTRSPAILVSLAYLGVGTVAWWASPAAPLGTEMSGSMLVLWAAVVLLATLATLTGDRATSWLTPAVVGPLALQPLTVLPGMTPAVLVCLLWPASALPLAFDIATTRAEQTAALGAATAAAAFGIAALAGASAAPVHLEIAGYTAVTLIVGLPVAMRLRRPRVDLTADQITERGGLLVAAIGPGLAGLVLVTSWEIAAVALVTAVLAVIIVSWIALRPLTWVAARANAQRDLAVAAGESERRRLAAELHDGPLQDVLLLARRLEDAGDAEGATLARSIGAELRELSGDLRLPMLDDLGVGPSLEWLAGRVRRVAAVDVEVAYAGDGRVPAPVELAAFRIAQEAIANAVRHGAPPIVVRCRTATDSLSLSVHDGGRGLDRGEIASAVDGERFGLLNMQQRAEQIGARLELRRPSGGGTEVALEWRAAPA